MQFALFSARATAVELCLFDPADPRLERGRAPLERSGDIWRIQVPDLGPGSLYGYRVDGPWDPERGDRFDAAKLLVDPRARALTGAGIWDETLVQRGRDSAPFAPRCIVVDETFDWGPDRPPATPWSETVLYECHVKGMTARHPAVPAAQRGRFAGLGHPAVLEHLRGLGVTALSLLPVQQHGVDPHLGRLGLPNYWGYATLAFFAPDVRFSAAEGGDPVREFKELVKNLHAADLEVILDVVYNHTPEGGADGSTLSLRGIDNAAYYRLDPAQPGAYEDLTGCGNSLDLRRSPALELVLESLRYWVEAMHVDGFRFDLAPVLARGSSRFDLDARFLEAVARDPLLSRVKLIAEPWDLGPDADQQGAFPSGWSEWNGRYRDCVRRFWRGDTGQRAELATRLAGSQDLYAWNGRGPAASINLVACHDGFTLHDLVSYAHRHNAANGESDRDGHNDEVSWNTGIEGPTTEPGINERRERAKRNLVATLAFSIGVPMLSHGDELSRTQLGNNNAYCQDGSLTWLDWELDPRREDFLAFVRRALALRHAHPALRRAHFFDAEEIHWFGPEGRELAEPDWRDTGARALGLWIAPRSGSAPDDPLILLLNGSRQSVDFALPHPGPWYLALDTAAPGERPLSESQVTLAPSSLVLLEHRG
jgi:isoamylase